MADYAISLAQVKREIIIYLPGPLYTLPLAMQEHPRAHIPCATCRACAPALHQVLEKEYLVFVPRGRQSSLRQSRELACVLKAPDDR